jgi:hypothetical protein
MSTVIDLPAAPPQLATYSAGDRYLIDLAAPSSSGDA